MRRPAACTAILCLVTVQGCSATELDDTLSKIQNGDPLPAESNSQWKVADPEPCTGTFVTPEWVLTAAHCYASHGFAGGFTVQAFGRTSTSEFTLFHPRGNAIWTEPPDPGGKAGDRDVDAVLLHIDPPIDFGGGDVPLSTMDTDAMAGQQVLCFTTRDGTIRYARFESDDDTCRDPDVHFQILQPNLSNQTTGPGDSGGACWVYNAAAGEHQLAGILEGGVCGDTLEISAEAFRDWVNYVTSRPVPDVDPNVWSTDKCSSTNQCNAYQGNCEADSDCFGPLLCGHDIGAAVGQPDDWDICKAPPNAGCPTFDKSLPTTAFCNEECPCGLGEGDCDSDGECRHFLVCKLDLGPSVGLPAGYDVCGLP